MPGNGNGGLQPPCEVPSAGTVQYIVVKIHIPPAVEPFSIPIHQNAMANVTMERPQDPSTTFTSKRRTIEEVEEIEAHVRTASSFPRGPYPSLTYKI